MNSTAVCPERCCPLRSATILIEAMRWHAMPKFTTCLMFVGEQHGKAEEAIGLYVSLFKNSKIIEMERWGLWIGAGRHGEARPIFS
jgi:hypothetical protein